MTERLCVTEKEREAEVNPRFSLWFGVFWILLFSFSPDVPSPAWHFIPTLERLCILVAPLCMCVFSSPVTAVVILLVKVKTHIITESNYMHPTHRHFLTFFPVVAQLSCVAWLMYADISPRILNVPVGQIARACLCKHLIDDEVKSKL